MFKKKLGWIHIHFKKCRQFISADLSRGDVLLSETTEAELWWVWWSWKWDVFSAIIIIIKQSCNDNLNLCSNPPRCSSTLGTFVSWRLKNKLTTWLCYKEKLCLTRQRQPYFVLMILPSMEHKRSNWQQWLKHFFQRLLNVHYKNLQVKKQGGKNKRKK